MVIAAPDILCQFKVTSRRAVDVNRVVSPEALQSTDMRQLRSLCLFDVSEQAASCANGKIHAFAVKTAQIPDAKLFCQPLLGTLQVEFPRWSAFRAYRIGRY